MILLPPTWSELIHEVDVVEQISYENISEFYASSAININVSSMHMPTSLNSRVFDVPISGGFLITDYRDGIYDLFDKDEIVTYQSLLDLIERINFYKTHEKAKISIVKRAAENIGQNHRYSNRINYILNKFKNNLS
jgi:spore maturation protein CgeB